MRVLVIGGTGVLSSAVAAHAVEQGHQVTILTDGKGPLPPPAGIADHILADRCDLPGLVSALRPRSKCWDMVVDCICYRPADAIYLHDALGDRAAHVVVISSAIVYDRHAPLPLRPASPVAPDDELGRYARDKLLMEQAWLRLGAEAGRAVTILRTPHILGAGAYLGVIPLHNRDPALPARLQAGKALLLADGGRQVIQVVFNHDVAEIVTRLYGNDRTFGKIYNCANPELLTAEYYYRTIAGLLDVPIRIKSVAAECIWQSDWGWSLSTFPRILAVDSLMTDIGPMCWTSARDAIAATLGYALLNWDARNLPLCPQIDRIESVLDRACLDLVQILDECARVRERLPIDLRMNRCPPIIEPH